MKCEECEILLAQEVAGPEVESHLAGCPACRSLADELQANAHALRALGLEAMPRLSMPVRRVYPWWKWASAAAALAVTVAGSWWISRPPRPPRVESVEVTVTGVAEPVAPAKVKPVSKDKVQPLLVKMLTPDPDVVIYWLIDAKEGEGAI